MRAIHRRKVHYSKEGQSWAGHSRAGRRRKEASPYQRQDIPADLGPAVIGIVGLTNRDRPSTPFSSRKKLKESKKSFRDIVPKEGRDSVCLPRPGSAAEEERKIHPQRKRNSVPAEMAVTSSPAKKSAPVSPSPKKRGGGRSPRVLTVCTCQPRWTDPAAAECIRCSGPCHRLFHAACAGYPLAAGGRHPHLWLCRACFDGQTSGGVACICRTAYNPTRYRTLTVLYCTCTGTYLIGTYRYFTCLPGNVVDPNKYIEFVSGSRIFAKFGSGSRVILSILK